MGTKGTQKSRRPKGDGGGGGGGEGDEYRPHACALGSAISQAAAPAGEAGLSRPRHSVRDTILSNLCLLDLTTISVVPVG